jgi:hypothetical protein
MNRKQMSRIGPDRYETSRGASAARLGISLALAVAFLLFAPGRGSAQIQDSEIDTIYVDTIGVPVGSFDAGDTIWVPVGVVNTFAVGGMGYRVEVADTTKIIPIYTLDAGNYPVLSRLVGRGLVFNKPSAVTSVLIRHPDTANILTGLLVDFEGTASIPTGRGAIIELAFLAKAGNSAGQNTTIRVRDDLTRPTEPRNNLSDVTGTLAVYPILRNGQIRFGETGPTPGNNAPILTLSPSTLAYTIKQGQTVTFSATADDPDTTNDQVTLSVGLPSGATFLPSNPVVGTDMVSGTFSWTPNYSQEGIFNVTVNASDNKGGSTNRTVAITVEKQDIDILFTTSADNDKPVGGIPGKKGVLLPIDVLASRDIYGVQFDLVLNGSALHVDSILPTSKLDNFTLWDNVGLNADTTRIVTFSITGDSIPLSSGTTIMQVAVTVDTSAAPGRYPVRFLNARESISPDPDQGSIEMVVENGAMYVDRMGDVNLDQSVDVADMVSLTAYILNRVALAPRNFDVADINADSSADVIDLVAIINHVLGFDTLGVPVHPVFEGGEAEFYLTYGGQTGDQAIYFVEGYMPTQVAGMELDFTYDFNQIEPYMPVRTGQASGLNMQSSREPGRMKIVAYYNADVNHAVPPGRGRYFILPVKVKQPLDDPSKAPLDLRMATVSDPDAAKVRVKGIDQPPVLPDRFRLYQNFPNPFNPETTIRFEIGSAAGSNVMLDVYNVLGQHVVRLSQGTLPAGEYDVTWDGVDRAGQRVASGVYFYRLQVGGDIETKKMVLLK